MRIKPYKGITVWRICFKKPRICIRIALPRIHVDVNLPWVRIEPFNEQDWHNAFDNN